MPGLRARKRFWSSSSSKSLKILKLSSSPGLKYKFYEFNFLSNFHRVYAKFKQFLSSLGQVQTIFNCSDGRVVGAFASEAKNWDLIPSRVIAVTLKLVLTASLYVAQH